MTSAQTPENRTVLVTGAAGALGRAVAQALDADGANLVLVDRDAKALDDVFGGADTHRLLAAADLLDAAAVERAVAAGVAHFGRLDGWCHVAGGFRMGEPVHETSDDTWNLLFGLNVGTLRTTARAVVPRLIASGGGSIVTVGALSSRQGLAGMGAYCASKDAVLRLSESMAAELGAHGIRVNCVLPSIIDTPANRASMPGADTSTWVAPADIAQTIAWLVGERSRAVQGVGLPVAGPR